MAKTKSSPESPEPAVMTEPEPVKGKPEAVFTKAQLMGSKHFQHRRDILQAVLDDDKPYTIKQAQSLIDEFFGRKVQ